MANLLPLKPNRAWDLNKSEYEEIDNLPLMKSPGPVCVILALYMVFVLKVGPDFMRKRSPFKLTQTLLVYNGIQVVFSFYLVTRFLQNLMEMGLTPTKCFMGDHNYRSQIIFGIWLYFAAKVTELLDTVLFILRKKDNQVTFLHLYHHSCMMIATWAILKYWPSESLIFIGFLNSLVHVFMYSYYALSALGPSVAKYLTWKKYMTKFQLIQFVLIIVQYVSSVRVSDCPPSKAVAIFIATNTVFFLILFANFYIQSYKKKSVVNRDKTCSTSSTKLSELIKQALPMPCMPKLD